MPVGSPLEVYTTILGWHLYGGIWKMLTGTGLAMIPFLAIIIGNMIEARANAKTTDIGIRAFRVAEIEIYIAFVVVMLFVSPMVTMNVNKVKYIHSSCEQDQLETDSSLSFNTGTTYDSSLGNQMKVLLDGESPKIPLVWWLISHYARAIPETAKQALPCSQDMRLLKAKFDSDRITDPILRDEVSMFHRDCWRPAANKYYREKPEVDGIEDPYLDISWAGSKIFNTVDGYYDVYRTTENLKSFPYDEALDRTVINPDIDPGVGRPFCKRWWNDSSYGLRTRLLDATDIGSTTDWRYWIKRTNMSATEAEDALLYNILTLDTDIQYERISNNFPRDSLAETVKGKIRDGVSLIGLGLASPVLYTTIHVIKQAAPMIQAIMLLLIICVMPILHVVSEYDLKTTATLMMTFISIQFWSFLFALADYIDKTLYTAMSQTSEADSKMALLTTSSEGLMNFFLVDFITGMMYLTFPSTFTGLMMVAGSKVGAGMEGALSSGAGGAGSKGAGGVSAVKTAATKGKG